jgi:hypothetical protein
MMGARGEEERDKFTEVRIEERPILELASNRCSDKAVPQMTKQKHTTFGGISQ